MTAFLNSLRAEVTNLVTGSNPTYKVTKEGRVYKRNGQEFEYNTRSGYLSVVLCNGDEQYQVKVHRLVAYIYCSGYNVDTLNVVDHLDGNKLNNHYSNLEWVTSSENQIRAIALGLRNFNSTSGENNYLSTFTEAALRECLENGYHPKITSKEFKILIAPLNCTAAQVKSLYAGRTWYNVTSQYGLIPLAEIPATERVGNKARKLTYEDAVLLREDLAAAVLTIKEVADKYGVSKVTVSRFYDLTSFNGRNLPVINLVKPAYKLEDKYSLATILSIKEQHALGKTRAELEQLFNINAQMCDKLRKLEDLTLFA